MTNGTLTQQDGEYTYQTAKRVYDIITIEEEGTGTVLYYTAYYGENSMVGMAVNPETIAERIDREEANEDA